MQKQRLEHLGLEQGTEMLGGEVGVFAAQSAGCHACGQECREMARKALILSKNSLPVPERAASAIISRRTSSCSGEQMKLSKLVPKLSSATAGSVRDASRCFRVPDM